MISLNQCININFVCPDCNVQMKTHGWYMPGMRMLVNLECPNCNKEYYGDLPAGHGLYYPMILEKETGRVHNKYGVEWFASWLEKSYQNRVANKIAIHKEVRRPIKCPVILNCLDGLYGHSLLKLLNAQYYIDNHEDKDLVVIIPKFLRWMVPDGVASIWTIDLPLKLGSQWNDSVADIFLSYFQSYEECYLSIALPHPDPSDIDIERFTLVQPFKTEKWQKMFLAPKITFIWREDRLWIDIFSRRLKNIINILLLRRIFHKNINYIDIQRTNIIKLATIMKSRYPGLSFAIAGIGSSGDFPSWFSDMRERDIDEAIERKWCNLFAESHVVVGVHGSNMLLPSALSGAIIELVPANRWGNLLQDILLQNNNIRLSISKIRLLDLNTPPKELAIIIENLIQYMPVAIRNFEEKLTNHEEIMRSPHMLSKLQSENLSYSSELKKIT